MQLKLQTSKLQEMVGKSIKGASNNKMIPLTSLMEIELKNHVLTLRTTDASNTLSIMAKDIDGEDFHTVVPSEMFSKLVGKITTNNITLTVSSISLIVKGNGEYQIELPLNDDGDLIKFPAQTNITVFESAIVGEVALSALKSVLNANKAAVAQTMELPYLTGYYFGEQVITTDSFKVCANAQKLIPIPSLLPSVMVELLSLVGDEKIKVYLVDNKVTFVGSDVMIQGSTMSGIEDYPVEPVVEYLKTKFVSHCQVNRNDLLNVLDRLSLFVSVYDKNGVYLTFTEEHVQFSSKRTNGIEALEYKTNTGHLDYSCCIDIELFKSKVAAQEGEVVELWYGNEKAIKMISGNITQIVSLLEDDRLNG